MYFFYPLDLEFFFFVHILQHIPFCAAKKDQHRVVGLGVTAHWASIHLHQAYTALYFLVSRFFLHFYLLFQKQKNFECFYQTKTFWSRKSIQAKECQAKPKKIKLDHKILVKPSQKIKPSQKVKPSQKSSQATKSSQAKFWNQAKPN